MATQVGKLATSQTAASSLSDFAIADQAVLKSDVIQSATDSFADLDVHRCNMQDPVLIKATYCAFCGKAHAKQTEPTDSSNERSACTLNRAEEALLTCLVKDFLHHPKQDQLCFFASCGHVAVGGLLMQAGWKEGVVAQSIALRDALLEIQGLLSEELHWKNTT